MVFYGYKLPKKNNDIRMANLKIALQNDEIKLYNNINLIKQNPANTPLLVEAKIESSLPKKEIIVPEPLNQRNYNTPITTPRTSITPRILNNKLIDLQELRSKISSPNLGLKTSPKANLDIEEKRPAPITTSLSTQSEQPISPTQSEIASNESEIVESKKTTPNDKLIDTIMKLFNKALSEDNFNGFYNTLNANFNDLTNIKKRDKSGNRSTQAGDFIIYKDGDTIKKASLTKQNFEKNNKKAWDYFKEDPQAYFKHLETLKDFPNPSIVGSGLFEPKKSSAASHSPNFGNLWLNEKLLKRNTLSIKRPYSNVFEITAKDISPLLKKMVIDIANTLEFDIKDYENLESDEKKIIERIINKQKDMKNYNIKTLIGDDINKRRKRLKILFAEVNNGNNSSIVLSEILDLLTQLYKDGGISVSKYNLLKQNVKSHIK